MSPFGPGVDDVLRSLNDPGSTLDLREVQAGDAITIALRREGAETTLKIRVTKPAGTGWGEDSLQGLLQDGTVIGGKTAEYIRTQGFPLPPVGETMFIVGSCTFSPGTPMGLTMLTMHRLTVGRSLLWGLTKSGSDHEYLSPSVAVTIQVRSCGSR